MPPKKPAPDPPSPPPPPAKPGTDAHLREHGFEISSRPVGGEPLWLDRIGRRVYPEKEAHARAAIRAAARRRDADQAREDSP